jgi:hypothetical protein
MSNNPFAAAETTRVNSNPFDAEPAAPDQHVVSLLESSNPFADTDTAHDHETESTLPEGDTPTWLREARSKMPGGGAVMDDSGANPFGTGQPSDANPFAAAPGSAEATLPMAATNPFGETHGLEEAANALVPPIGDVALPLYSQAPPSLPPIEVEPTSFSADMAQGCAGLLASGRHADMSFELPARSLLAHRAIIEARCGAALIQALEGGALGSALVEGGLVKIALAVHLVGDASGAPLSALLR